jgi:hypothetical protein
MSWGIDSANPVDTTTRSLPRHQYGAGWQEGFDIAALVHHQQTPANVSLLTFAAAISQSSSPPAVLLAYHNAWIIGFFLLVDTAWSNRHLS